MREDCFEQLFWKNCFIISYWWTQICQYAQTKCCAYNPQDHAHQQFFFGFRVTMNTTNYPKFCSGYNSQVTMNKGLDPSPSLLIRCIATPPACSTHKSTLVRARSSLGSVPVSWLAGRLLQTLITFMVRAVVDDTNKIKHALCWNRTPKESHNSLQSKLGLHGYPHIHWLNIQYRCTNDYRVNGQSWEHCMHAQDTAKVHDGGAWHRICRYTAHPKQTTNAQHGMHKASPPCKSS